MKWINIDKSYNDIPHVELIDEHDQCFQEKSLANIYIYGTWLHRTYSYNQKYFKTLKEAKKVVVQEVMRELFQKREALNKNIRDLEKMY